jgi:hypothetical protein
MENLSVCKNDKPVVWSDSLLSALGLGSFSLPLSKGESLLLVTIWPKSKELNLD